MIGTITFTSGGVRRVVTLDEARNWTIAPPLDDELAATMATVLEGIADDYGGPADGFFGPRQIAEAAAAVRLFLGATKPVVRLEPRKPGPPGRVY
jgi:hypothetical protein